MLSIEDDDCVHCSFSNKDVPVLVTALRQSEANVEAGFLAKFSPSAILYRLIWLPRTGRRSPRPITFKVRSVVCPMQHQELEAAT